MLPKNQRLRTRRDFDLLWKRSHSVYGKTLGVRFAPNKTGKNRIAVVVGTKISKRSTKRNLVRRRIREAIRKQFIGQLKGVDLVVVTRTGILDRTYKEIVAEISEILKKARVI